ncbi:MAG: aspartate carbamoyltransferase catalytic subunit [Desulfobacterales bacterium]|jgi:aspartate carbamoyltransferase catalytic subunit
MGIEQRHILDMASLSTADIRTILDTAVRMKEISRRSIKKVPTLRGKTVVQFFYEPSTRTKSSFDIAAKRLSADSLSFSKATSSVVKGESLLDTVQNIEAMQPDVIIIRHPSAGAPHFLTRHCKACVINAGDGMHAHPTQALLDLMTVREKIGHLKGLNILIVGDIAHSRVARSNIIGFQKMGARVTVCGPPTMMPLGIEQLGAKVAPSLDEAIGGADIIMMLRIQKERQNRFLMSDEREYATVFGLNLERLRGVSPDVLIMHPGPMNRGVEIDPEVADGPYSVILDQVTNGVAVRMALLYLVLGGK